MALPNPYEVEIPSDSEDEDEYIEAVWIDEPEECPGKVLCEILFLKVQVNFWLLQMVFFQRRRWKQQSIKPL